MRRTDNPSPHQNFAIVAAFGIGFVLILLILSEFNTKLSGETSVTLFKHGSKAEVIQAAHAEVSSNDEEKSAPKRSPLNDGEPAMDQQEMQQATPDVKDVFTFQHLSYTVPIGGGKNRKLLDDVSGYVRPGKLTALMGESGAGKVRPMIF